MPSEVSIEIKGVALIFPFTSGSSDYWKVWFPFDDEITTDNCHDLRITINHNGSPLVNEKPYLKKDRVVSFNLDYFSNGNELDDKVFKLTDSKAHGSKRIKKKDSEFQFVELIIPKIKFDGKIAKLENGKIAKYALFQSQQSKYKVKKKPFEINQSIISTLNTVNSFDINANDLAIPIFESKDNTGKYEIIFDNDCYTENSMVNDFKMVYDHLIEEKGPNKRRFHLEWVPEFIEDTLIENDDVDKLMFKFAQLFGRILEGQGNIINNIQKTKDGLGPVVANDITYPCFVYGGDGVD